MRIADAQGAFDVFGVEPGVEQAQPMVRLGSAGMGDALGAAEHRHQIGIGFDMGVKLGQDPLEILRQQRLDPPQRGGVRRSEPDEFQTLFECRLLVRHAGRHPLRRVRPPPGAASALS